MEIGNRIAELRKEKGISRVQFAQQIGIPSTTLRNYETGAREPGHSFIIQMAKEFHVSTDYLLGLTDNRKQNDIKKSPEPNDPGSEAMYEELGFKIYKTLLEYGYVSPGQDLTEDQIDFLDHITAIISAYFNN